VILFFHVADELVPNARNRLDQARGAAVVLQGLANFADALSQRVFCDVDPGPNRVEELFLFDHPAPVLDEVHQELERLWWEVDIQRAAKEAALGAVEGKVAEPKNLVRLRHETPRMTASSVVLQNFVRPASRLHRRARSY
jgi:hypothetical protein